MRSLVRFVLLTVVLHISLGGRAQALTHIVQPGETLASVAEGTYGRIQYEKILVAANALEAQGGSPIVPGMRLEVPVVSYHRVTPGETWPGLAKELLGAAHRADVLAFANGSKPWLTPEADARVLIPYNLRVVCMGGETIVGLAYKYLGHKKKAYLLDVYNGLRGRKLVRGDVILVPLTDLPLTPAGAKEARRAEGAGTNQAEGDHRAVQVSVAQEIPALIADVRHGRYVDAVTRGSRFLALGELTVVQQRIIHRQLLEAFVALGSTGKAVASCSAWRALEPKAKLDPILLSPKIIAACERGGSPK